MKITKQRVRRLSVTERIKRLAKGMEMLHTTENLSASGSEKLKELDEILHYWLVIEEGSSRIRKINKKPQNIFDND